jgi:hypothetical protein
MPGVHNGIKPIATGIGSGHAVVSVAFVIVL